MTARDPRTDPRPGDVVKFPNDIVRSVTKSNVQFVHYDVALGRSYMPIKLWRRWATHATIIQRGTDE